MHQQLWGYKVEWKSVSRGTGGKKVEYHCLRPRGCWDTRAVASTNIKDCQCPDSCIGYEARGIPDYKRN